MLIVDLHALQAVNVLNLVHHVFSQSFHTHDLQNIMWGRVAIHDVFAFLDEVTFLNRNVAALRHHVFHGF